MSDAILILNAGSSSIKFSLFPARERPVAHSFVCEGEVEGIGNRSHFNATGGTGATLRNESLPEAKTHEDAVRALVAWVAQRFADRRIVGAGHRIVHGGSLYSKAILVDARARAALRALIPLAPLHQPHTLAALDALDELYPGIPQVACFDTAFHQGAPNVAKAFAIPRRLSEEGVVRYGFHGLSYEYIASVLADVTGPEVAAGRVVVAHLGAGASMCAMRAGASVATTFGFTALDGLPMMRRCGSIDPGVLLYLLQEKKMEPQALSDLLYNDSGLFGVSGISDDMRVLLESTDPRAKEAVDLFVYRIGRELGSLAAALGGIDALIFTAGIGEHATEIRRRVCIDAAWLGIEIDAAANANGAARITSPASRVSAWVIPTDEDLMIAQHTWDILNKTSAPRIGK